MYCRAGLKLDFENSRGQWPHNLALYCCIALFLNVDGTLIKQLKLSTCIHTSLLWYNTFCASCIIINKLFFTILYHDAIYNEMGASTMSHFR